jgi:hypothetical protein
VFNKSAKAAGSRLEREETWSKPEEMTEGIEVGVLEGPVVMLLLLLAVLPSLVGLVANAFSFSSRFSSLFFFLSFFPILLYHFTECLELIRL